MDVSGNISSGKRLIDADALMRIYQEVLCPHVRCVDCSLLMDDGTCRFETMIREAPAIDAVPIADAGSVREKLVELIESARCCGSNTSEEIAENLISNGVTVQEWISVDDRLPENEKEGVLIGLRWGEVDIGWCEDGRWSSEFVNEYEDGEVTHWMPLPEPPKGE